MKFKNKNFNKGVSIIEAIVLIFVFSVTTLSFYSVFAVGSKYILNSKNKIIAVSLVNERMEMLRNLAYDDVAIIGGIPAGSVINQNENVTVGDKTFRVFTDISYRDDPDDGIFGGSPNDNVSNDYKIVEVTVYWGGESLGERATLSSRFVPPGVETGVGGGTFSINSIDYAGNPVPNVSVNIFNNQISPAINYTTHTDTNGSLLLQGVPADAVQNYKITMSKTGYETVVTYSPLSAGFLPEDAHSNIIAGVLNEKTVIIDLLSDIIFTSKDPFGEDLPNVAFDIVGGRRLDDGTVPPGNFTYTDTITTDSNGEFSDSDINAGRYTLDWEKFNLDSSTHQFRKIELGDDLIPSSFILVPGTNFVSDIVFMDKNIDSAFIKILDLATSSIIANATVQLRNTTLSYDVTLTTDKYGYVYFPKEMVAPLQNGEIYEILISANNYQNKTDSITIDKLTTKEISLEAI